MFLFPQQETLAQQITNIFIVLVQSNGSIRPHFHLTGPSGSGKSFLIRQLADQANIPFMEINAAGLTAEGLSGNSLSKALRKLKEQWATPNIIFVDEFDKLFQRNGENTEGFRTAVQDEFLTSLESKYTSVFGEYGKYDQVIIENSLFIFAGAYSNQKITTHQELRDAGLRTEFIGRVPLIYATEKVDIKDIINLLPKAELFQKYIGLSKVSSKTAAEDIAKMIQEQDNEFGIGIRLMNSCIHQYFISKVNND